MKTTRPDRCCLAHDVTQTATRFIILSTLFCLTPCAHAILDTNNNGVSDLWEREFNNGQLLQPDFNPLADSDGDGWTNEMEAAANTNPFEANPPDGTVRTDTLHIPATYFTNPENETVLLTPEAYEINWPTVAGKRYTLSATPDLAAGSWFPIGDPFIAFGGTTSTFVPITQLDGSSPDKLFWRVAIADADLDADGLTEHEEYLLGTDPTDKTTLGNFSDFWLATYFTDVLLNGGLYTIDPNADPDGDGASNTDEAIANTDPTTADPATTQQWVSVTGNGDEDEPITRTGTLTIPAGESRILVVAIASDEYPYFTGTPSQFDDLLEWDATPSQGDVITGAINVNSRHADWMIDETNGTSIPGFPSPTHFELIRTLTAPANAPLTITVEVTATNVSDDILPSHVAVGLMPVTLEWKPIDGWDNVSAHIDPWSNAQKGQRIFPDFENPDSTELHHKLQVVVKTSPALKGQTVFVKSFDVDDSTSEAFDKDEDPNSSTFNQPVIDTNHEDGDDNLPDYLATPKSGLFWTGTAWAGDTKEGIIDENGEAKFDFRVGMQPGNNYRVVASMMDESAYSAVHTDEPDELRYIGCEFAENGGVPASPLLTVWRRLWVENDSMTAIPTDTFGYKRNDLSNDLSSPLILTKLSDGTNTLFGIPTISDLSSFENLEHGKMIVQSIEHAVIGTSVFGNTHFVQLSGDLTTTVPLNSGFRLYDDDDFGLVHPALPRNDLIADNVINHAYNPAYIEVMDAKDWNTNKTVAFYPNHPPIVGSSFTGYDYGILDDALDAKLEGNEKLWCASIMVAYQPGAADSDPNDESIGVNAGVTVGDSLQFAGKARVSIIYSEVVRDIIDAALRTGGSINNYEQRLCLTAAHEIGHQPLYGLGEAAHHGEDGLMVDGGHAGMDGPDTPFTSKSIKRFRSVHQWRQKE